MKRPLIIIISVVVVFLLLGAMATSFRFGSSFSSANRSLGYGFGGGGGAAPEAVAPPMEEPSVSTYDAQSASDVAKSGDTFNAAGQPIAPQERLVIENADLALVVKDPKARMA